MNTKHLKAKILDLAIRGKLVPQDSSEGNAADLLQKIRDEKYICHPELDSEPKKKIKTDKNVSFIIKADDGRHYEQFADGTLKDIEDEIPFEIPESWCWCRLPSLCKKQITDGTHNSPPNTKKGDFLYITAKNIKFNGIDLKDVTYVTKKIHDEIYARCNPEKGDVLLTKDGTIGEVTVNNLDYEFSMLSSIALIKPTQYIASWYLAYVLKSESLQKIMKGESKGSALRRIVLAQINTFLIPLPPLAEQKRIVTVIEKTFEQIDIIEKNKLNLKTYIKQTKAKVLNLAIHGKLAEQNPQEGNAFELLEKIRNEKLELIKQKKLKEDKKSSLIIKAEDGKHYEQFADGTLKDIEDEIPFDIPENWCWCRLSEISNSIIAGGDKPAICSKEKTSENIIPIYANAIEKDGLYGYTNKPQITEKAITISARGTIGFSCIREHPFVPIVRLIVLVPNLSIIDLKYLKASFDSLLNMTEGSSIPQLTIPSIKTFLLPLPSLSEQQRIVDKIEQVFQQLDILEKSLGE